MKRKAFDVLAPYYDALASLIFGKSLLRSQLVFLNKIDRCKSVLVIGGGTGRFMPKLIEVNPACEIWYIDSSQEMLTRAKKRIVANQVHFIKGTEESIPQSLKADAIISFCFLDLFEKDDLDKVIGKIAKSTTPGALWLVSDFTDNGKWWQKFLLKSMYLFFRTICDIPARSLPPWKELMEYHHLEALENASFFRGFIESKVYRHRPFR